MSETDLIGTAATLGPDDWTSEMDFKISAKLIYANGKEGTELRPIITEFSYFEDLYGNITSGYVMLSDSSNYQDKMSMFGDEFIKFELERSRNNPPSPPLKRYQRVYNMANRNLSKDSNENYKLRFASEEMILSDQYRVSKAYKAKVSDIVKDIAISYLRIPEKDLNITPTLGVYHIIVPNLKPMDAINWLCTLAICEDTRIIGASYTFFQNRNGWYFVPVLGLYGDYQKYGGGCANSDTTPYEYKVKNNQSEEDKFGPKTDPNKNILSYEIISSYDMNEYTMDGAFANRLYWNDNFKRLHEIKHFDYKQYFDQLKSNLPLYRDKQPFSLLTNAVDRCNKQHNEVPETVVKMAFRTENNRVEQTIPYRYPHLRHMFAIRIRIVLLGDVSLHVGKVIYVEIKNPAPVSSGNNDNIKKKMDKMYSGYYLILALRHRLDQETGFETVLELGKDSFLSAVDASDNPGLSNFDNSLPIIQEARKKGYF